MSLCAAGISENVAILKIVSVDAGNLKICYKTAKAELKLQYILTLTLLKNTTILNICRILVLAITCVQNLCCPWMRSYSNYCVTKKSETHSV